MNYRCPICSSPLHTIEKSYACENRHQFDMAKEGYVNLLPVQNKKSKNPGDNKEMMLARREFLDQGYYQCLSDKVNEIAQVATAKLTHIRVLDLGCGEGYYTNRLSEALSATSPIVFGLDISKSAIRYAAKRYKSINFSVASAYDTPFKNESHDLIMRIYAPSLPEELKRIIKMDGCLITVTPGAEHLFELKEKIYQTPEKHDMTLEEIEGFTAIDQHRLTEKVVIEKANDIANLLAMTPLAWKMSEEQKSEICSSPLTVTLDFNINRYQRAE